MSSEHATGPRRIMVVYGTRPEAIKLAPVIRALCDTPEFDPHVVVTGQHREMLDQVNEVFGIRPDLDLDIHQAGQTLTDITAAVLRGLQRVLADRQPDAVIVQGDTTTTMAAALASFYARVPVVHLEAGLRTNNPLSPYPEELNRRLTTQLASLHLAPTGACRANLLAENVDPDRIVVTGNSVIDALKWTINQSRGFRDPLLADLDETDGPVLLVTAHRRESWGEPLRGVGRALARLATAHPDLEIVFPVHRNPLVREAVLPAVEGFGNVRIIEPLPYGDFCQLMYRATIILTDSGGVQEEGPSLGKPVLVMRDTTERPEAVTSGTVRLTGTDEDTIVDEVTTLLRDPEAYGRMANAVNPYGDGLAAERTVGCLARFFGFGPPVAEFRPERPTDPEHDVIDLRTASARAGSAWHQSAIGHLSLPPAVSQHRTRETS